LGNYRRRNELEGTVVTYLNCLAKSLPALADVIVLTVMGFLAMF
jgi:hypothetical protein